MNTLVLSSAALAFVLSAGSPARAETTPATYRLAVADNAAKKAPAKDDSAEAKPLDPNRPAEAPAEAEVKKQLEKFWGRERVTNTYNYKTLKYGKPRKGEYRTDGVPANSNTMVYPVKVVCDHVVGYYDGTSKTETKSQQFVFFKDDFDAWTYRFKGNVE